MTQVNPEAAMMAQMMGVLGQPQPTQDIPSADKGEAQEGRGGDAVLAHLTPGELVIPEEALLDPELNAAVESTFRRMGIDINEFLVGHEKNKVNPETGNPEFFFKSIKRIYKKATKPFRKATRRLAGKLYDDVFGIQDGQIFEIPVLGPIAGALMPTALSQKYLVDKARKAGEEEARKQGEITRQRISQDIARYEERIAQQVEDARLQGEKAAARTKASILISNREFEAQQDRFAKDADAGPTQSVVESGKAQTEVSGRRTRRVKKRSIAGPERPA